MDEVLLIAGRANPVLVDYANHCLSRGRRNVTVIADADIVRQVGSRAELHLADTFSPTDFLATHAPRRVARVVVFLDKAVTPVCCCVLEAIAALSREVGCGTICIISTFRAHFAGAAAAKTEADARKLLEDLPARIVVLRPSHVLSPHSRMASFLRRFWFCYPLVPAGLKGCCIEGEELFRAIDQELDRADPRRTRTYTLLGENRPWQARLRESRSGRPARAYAALMDVLVPLAILRVVAGWLLEPMARRWRWSRPWHVDTLRPQSIRELLVLYNKYNHRHVKVVGYNNGVVHFNQRFPGKTIVSTVGCNQHARVRGYLAEFDAGVTIRRAMDVLTPLGQELHVLPNYSYVSLGTAFFIPIHGSASKFTTVAETIERVTLYDPVKDRILAARRDEPVFARYLYNLDSSVLLLRLRLQTKEKSRYYVKRLEQANPTSQEILDYFHDNRPSNVEIRKAGSAAQTITVTQYFTKPPEGEGTAQELPRDAIGRLWDRLEENPITSVLFHALTRWLAYHVELFLSAQEFAKFWDAHRSLRILKIQLRYVRSDGFSNSPFRDHDCIAADLFMRKRHRKMFVAYLNESLPSVAMNPGKQTM
jgi:hypothetical protein